MTSPKSSTAELQTRSLAPSAPGGKIRVEGKFRVSGSVAYTPPIIDLAASPFSSFLQTGEDVDSIDVIASVSSDAPHQPWRRISYDTFDSNTNDWQIRNIDNTTTHSTKSLQILSHCGDHNLFLGGHCKAGGQHVLHKQVDFSATGHHVELRVVAHVHMIDSWDGELAWMKVDGNVVWTTMASSNSNTKTGMSICGDDKMNDESMNTLVDIVVPHSNKQVEISFGTSLDEHACDESIGIDNVQLFVH